jgi:hypothetical protein
MAALKRLGVMVPAPGGNEWSQTADCQSSMDQYIHLCFCKSHPMEYKAKQDGRIQESIFLNIDPSVLREEGVLFTIGVSNSSGIEKYTINQADSLIDFEVICERMDWNDNAILARRKKAEKCEILVPKKISINLIRNMPNG